MPVWLTNFIHHLESGDPGAIGAAITGVIFLFGGVVTIIKWPFTRGRSKRIKPVAIEQITELVQYEDRSHTIKRLNQAIGLREDVIRTIFEKLGHSDVAPENYPSYLVKIVEEIQRLQTELGNLRGDGPEVQELFDKAKAAVEKQDFEKAEKTFKRVERISMSAASGAIKSAAQAKAARAGLQKICLNYEKAGQLYREAAILIEGNGYRIVR